MKKMITALIVAVVLLFSSCHAFNADDISSAGILLVSSDKTSTSSQPYVKPLLSADEIDSVTITHWASSAEASPTKKIITSKQTIQKIVDVWNNVELTQVYETVKPGTTLSVNVGEEFGFSFCGGYIITDKKTFKYSEGMQRKILEIYQNATEKAVPYI